MSLKGAILVYNCDDCGELLIVNIERDDAFSSQWFFGVTHDFCNFCKTRVRNQAMIETDEVVWEKMSERIGASVVRRIADELNRDNELILDLSRNGTFKGVTHA